MSFVVLVLVLLVGFRFSPRLPEGIQRLWVRLVGGIRTQLDAGLTSDGWVASGLLVLLVALPALLAGYWSRGFLPVQVLLETAALGLCFAFWPLSHELQAATLSAARRPGETTAESRAAARAALEGAHLRVLAPLFWYAVLPGVAALLAYVVLRDAEARWRTTATPGFARAAARACALADWLPQRASALTFAIAGSFEDALEGWRAAARSGRESIAVGTALGALSVHLEGKDAVLDAGALESIEALIWRGLGLWLGLLLLLALARVF